MQEKNYALFNDIPEYLNVRELLDASVAKYGSDVAYTYRAHGMNGKRTEVTYEQFQSRVRAIGTQAIEAGFANTHVALIGKVSYAWISVYFSMLTIGAVLVPLDRDWPAEDLADTVKKAECTVLFCEPELREKANRIAAECGITTVIYLGGEEGETLEAFRAKGEDLLIAGDDRYDKVEIDSTALAELVFTSGTTGKGKGVMLNQRALLSNLYGAFRILKVPKKTFAILPPHHTYGSTIGILAPFCFGCSVYISMGTRYLLQEMQAEKPEFLILVPLYLETFYNKIWSNAKSTGKDKALRALMKMSDTLRKVGLDRRRALFSGNVLSAFGGNLTTIICGGAPLNQSLIDAFDTFGITVVNGYGITECSPLISANRVGYRVPGSVGVPLPNGSLRIDAPNEEGEGEICVRAPYVMMGYYKDAEATAKAIDKNGYFHTGDIGRYEDGVLYITGRIKNLIILSNGKNVYPEEIEAKLSEIPGVAELVVYEGVSKRDPGSDTIVAEIYPDADYMAQNGIADVEAYFSKHIANYNRDAIAYKKIGLLRIRKEEFPKNTLRKITRFKLDRTID